ncbi:MAG: hypothetical protein HWE24_16190 [Oceanospirillaceae bacterium]|jgi:hypothetical protein|nr:hypothetical protein [Oceanospirillaceae bacterium]
MEKLFEKTDYEIELFRDDASNQSENVWSQEDHYIREDSDEIESDWINKRLQRVYKTFEKEYNSYVKKGEYFYGCPFNVYNKTFNSRLKEYIKNEDDLETIDFIKRELNRGISSFERPYMEKEMSYRIEASLRKRFDFLSLKAKEENYEILIPDDTNGFRLSKMDASSPDIEIGADLTDLNIPKKVLFLYELGVIDFLKTKTPFNTNCNALSRVFSAITGEKTSSLNRNVAPIHSSDADNPRNPLNNQTNYSQVKHELNEIGYRKLE